MDIDIDSNADEGDRLGFELVESKVGTAEIEMDEGEPAAVTARDSEIDLEQRAEPDVMMDKRRLNRASFERRRIEQSGRS
jgi:hypothetical protein